MALANTARVTLAQQVLLNSLPQTPPTPPLTGNTYTNLKAANMTWAQYVSLREQGFIVEDYSSGAEPGVAITDLGKSALTF